MNHENIIIKLNEYIDLSKNKDKVFKKIIDTNKITFLNLRDRLLGMGTILEENFEETFYIIQVASGLLNKNNAIVVVKWNSEEISFYGYAQEGLINQHTAEKAIEKLIEKIRS